MTNRKIIALFAVSLAVSSHTGEAFAASSRTNAIARASIRHGQLERSEVGQMTGANWLHVGVNRPPKNR